MIEKASNEELANGKKINEGEQAKILSQPQCKFDFEISDEE